MNAVTDFQCLSDSLFYDDDYRLRLSSKKLKSGKCQVKFYATVEARKNLYGYVLVESNDKLKDVVGKIKTRLDLVKRRDSLHHINLYSIGKNQANEANILIFDA